MISLLVKTKTYDPGDKKQYDGDIIDSHKIVASSDRTFFIEFFSPNSLNNAREN